MEKDEILNIVDEIYSMPFDTIEDIQNLKEKTIELGNLVDEQDIKTVFKFVCINAFTLSLK